ncbi:MAG: prolipoprotein diacylglyceryl transferase [Candidatus Peregrinibacteria bacterium GW2011_GWF2_33_10]|nr:MAG: prolipoprotein diacylglyceryl transferase [Candidatus Peregrinibacteria bacterium GW2011_GWF2_33_10]OGJ44799.1 MAG: prolipoprotein diacylglyceryl transferase [Candidatus Peregrinibacteria bacterium RIFOXYA2_FULL_33_21]OGJ47382.1 MAG: prolipoprotein diacylglyceryl transferase [Candidatus Peregrinibacteria bacterium RIFOXYA12_FULL_33_12]OGJ50485.1 MAG: prolipoprotein diacylglyceryl transferase [Candidatus Peregrinibacteria bacterium RIFOXYB2_FULL_33_20]
MFTWNVNPEIMQIGPLALRYYSLLFATGLISAYLTLRWIYKKEKKTPDEADTLALYIIIGAVIGARLGHTLFYEFSYYSKHIAEIFLPWHGTIGKNFEFTGYQGLSSHGGAIGVILALLIFVKRYKSNLLWIADRLAICIPLTAGFVRLGNLMNSEIIGQPSNLPWAFIFQRIDDIPRHPTQLYESLSYFTVFLLLLILYKHKKLINQQGQLSGLFLTILFSLRFLIEFAKENQEAFENNWILDMGQILSIPFILFGLFLITKKSFIKNAK